MRIEVKGRNFRSPTSCGEHVEKRFEKIARQVSELAELEVELREERNPAIPDAPGRGGDAAPQGRDAARARRVARHGATRSTSCADELARQVKRHRDKRRKRRREARAAAAPPPGPPRGRGGGGPEPRRAIARRVRRARCGPTSGH